MKEILDRIVEQDREKIIETVKRLVDIPSVIDETSSGENAPFGKDIRRAQDELIKIAEELGFSVKDYDGYAAAIDFGENGDEIGILSHIDVVPAGDGWCTDPFVATIIDNKMYGRGTLDDKGPLVAALFAMKAIRDSNLSIKNHIRHIVGCDEETAHRCIKYYLTKEEPPVMGFSPDGSFSVIHAEKGIVRCNLTKVWKNNSETEGTSLISVTAGTVVNAVPAKAEAIVRAAGKDREAIEELCTRHGVSFTWEGDYVKLSAKGVSAHAMQPWMGENALLPILNVLHHIDFTSEEERDAVEVLYHLFGDGWEGKGLGIRCEDDLSGKLSVNLGVFKIEEGRLSAKLDIRCPIHMDLDLLLYTLQMTMEKNGLSMEPYQIKPALYIPKDTPLVQALLNIYNEKMDANEKPIVIGGGTYCRDVKNFVSYGPVFPGDPELAHEANEFIELEKLVHCTKLYAQALYALLEGEA